MMKRALIASFVLLAVAGCGASEEPAEQAAAEQAPLIEVEAPEPIPEPEPKTVASDTDWEAKAHNKEIEVIQVIIVVCDDISRSDFVTSDSVSKIEDITQRQWTGKDLVDDLFLSLLNLLGYLHFALPAEKGDVPHFPEVRPNGVSGLA